MQPARIGVAVLTYNRCDELRRTLDHLACLPGHPPIVVADNGSTDATRELLECRLNVTAIHLPNNQGASARNAAVAALDCPYVALCDDDTWWLPGSLETAARILDHAPRHAVLVARVLAGHDSHLDPASKVMAESPLPAAPGDPGVPVLGFLAGASVIRRHMFLAAGGFHSRYFIGGEEELLSIDFAARGWRMSYVPALVVRHMPSANRDAGSRNRLLERNALWTAWLRRSRGSVARATGCALWRALRARDSMTAFASAVRGLPWVVRERRPVAPALESKLRLVESGRSAAGQSMHATHLQRGGRYP